MDEPQVVRKGEFAEMRGVTPGRVSQWIAEGKIKGSALVGEGRSARILVPIAIEQLRQGLDINQRFGLNGVSTLLDDPPPPAAPQGAEVTPPAPLVDTVESQIKANKLRQAQLMTSRLEEEDRVRRGLYVDAAAARAELGRVAGDMLKVFEGALPDFASALTAKFQIPHRDVVHLLRQEFRRVRERASHAAAVASTAEPRLIADASPQPTSVQ